MNTALSRESRMHAWKRRVRTSAFSNLVLSCLVVAGASLTGCTIRSGSDTGIVSAFDAGTVPPTRPDTGPRVDVGAYDPFDSANACASSTIPTAEVPGSVLIVFDRSTSMQSTTAGRSRWDVARESITGVLGSVSDDLGVGLLLFPNDGGSCDVPLPDVPIAPLASSRVRIATALAEARANGSDTPAFAALLAGYEHLATDPSRGRKALVLVSDGGEGCDLARRSEVIERVQSELADYGHLTFAVGLDHSDNDMSAIAYHGGTAIDPGCRETCTTQGPCLDDADCGGAACLFLEGSRTGFCSCIDDTECFAPQTCEPPEDAGVECFCSPRRTPEECARHCAARVASRCEGPPPGGCCNYQAFAASFQADFEAALGEIAARLLDSCVFEVPRGDRPEDFDPSLVNVRVTFEDGSHVVLSRGSADREVTWDYTDASHETIVVHGAMCDRLRSESATVDIALGCPTILD